jgi:hypothetical protein
MCPCVQVLLAEYGLGAVALYYLAPYLLGGLFGSLRGFAGEVTAAQALDLVGSDGSAVIIDIRTEVRGALDAVMLGSADHSVVSQLWRCATCLHNPRCSSSLQAGSHPV